MQQKRHDLQSQITVVQERMEQIQRRIHESRKEADTLAVDPSLVMGKKQLLHDMEKRIALKEGMYENKLVLERKIAELIASITQRETLSYQSQHLLETIPSLNLCPTCLQLVSLDHK